MAKLTDFMVSRVRAKLIKIFLSQPSEMFYVRQLTRLSSEEINAVRRELARMQRVGMIKSEHRGNRLYYFFKPSYSFYPEFLSLVAKTSGLGLSLLKNRQKLGKIKYLMFSGRFVRGLPPEKDQVDLLVIGQVILPQLTILVRNFEAKSKKEVNYTIMTEDELKYRKSRRDPFILSILSGSRIMIYGDELELVSS